MAFTNLWWRWSKKQKEEPKVRNGAPRNSSPNSGLVESDTLKVQGGNMGSSARRIKRHSREARKIDKEHDVVIVPSDGVSLSGSESDDSDSDWSIGWLEPHGSSFQNDDDSDDSFAVLVPCYGRGRGQLDDKSRGNILDNIGRIPDLYGEESKKHMERWLSSLQNG
ncbi:OLC1v1017222C1 [Oldenlandia corymbosa var. corymbosa]|uniref:OLC1v1017222C1 n=1 Tax=Oldenlandia corymbosa var. corymbosa TaxID=529605 RepID=A0AAV1E900_OLDCO|nr:OLC1v1017222C1 [Oldenlandia corymbosa var. corymbosa]